MLVSHDEHQPRPIRIAALRVSASDLRNCSAAQWGEFYMIHAAAEGLMDVLVKELDVVAGAEIPLLQGSVEYGPHPQLGCSAAPIVLRDAVAGSRQLCDICAASILCTYYTCSMCATEICILCFAQWNESPGRQGERIAASSKELSNPIEKCKRFGRGKAVAQIRARHCRSQFVRVSTVSVADIKAVANKASAVLTLGNELGPQDTFDCDGIFSESLSALFEARIADIQKRAGALDEWELPTVYVMPDELSTRDFSQLWRRGVVVVVRGLLSAMDPELWRPEWWIRNAGHLLVNVWDCARGTAMDEAWKLGEFFRLFDGDDVYAHLFDGPPDEPSKGDDDVGMEAEVAMAAEGPMPQEGVVPQEDTKPDQSDLDTEAEGAKLKEKKEAYKLWLKHAKQVKRRILKLKDWPTADDFATVLPEHFERMMAALPFPDYTSRSGRLNMAARLPADHVPADLGPKMYCAYASSEDANGVGTTNLHCDAADAVNIMAYAAPLAEGAPAAAVWDIYPPEAASAIREFIGKSPKGSDPIHDQMRYLTRADRQRLFREKGIRCYRIYQNPGDAVFVPAGCAHQVCNYANAVKVAMDFVSPERIHFCRRLGADFRKLPSIHPRSSDLLQLSSLLWWALVKGSCAAPK
ncbi:hypothetical protein EV175_001490 [Coemansia sp. RSA 1933]|nr:hypothetical protein EV175_001490 [Coemansia sp. RSA 1933]